MYAKRKQAMNTIETKLNILIDSLRKKEQSLLEIVSITENQGTVLDSELPSDQAQAFVAQMNREKQAHIQSVLQCDSLFETVLKEIGPALDADHTAYKPQVETLQDGIKRVMDLDVKIRVLEEKNNQRVLTQRNAEAVLNKKPGIPKDTKKLIEAYKNNARN
jgi:hypothetical protein